MVWNRVFLMGDKIWKLYLFGLGWIYVLILRLFNLIWLFLWSLLANIWIMIVIDKIIELTGKKYSRGWWLILLCLWTRLLFFNLTPLSILLWLIILYFLCLYLFLLFISTICIYSIKLLTLMYRLIVSFNTIVLIESQFRRL